MDWGQFAMLWGPAVPLMAILIRAHWLLVYKTIPDGFRLMLRLQRHADRRAEMRHKEHIDVMRSMGAKKRPAPRPRKAQPGRRKRRKTAAL